MSDQWKNAIDENDIATVKQLVQNGADASTQDNWAIFQAFSKGFYDLAAYLGTLPEVRKRLLTSDCLTQEQRTHLVNFPTTISIGPFEAPKNLGPVEVLQVRRPAAPVRPASVHPVPVRPAIRAKEENIEFSDEESEEYDEDDEEADSWVVSDDVIEYEDDYDPNDVVEDPARETWQENDWKQMINKMQQGRLKN